MKRLKFLAALAGAASLVPQAAVAGAVTYHATLNGAQEVGEGDPDGSASADVTVSEDRSTLCYDVHDIRNIGPVTGAHIHRGAAGTNGPHLIPLTGSGEAGFKGCVDAPEWLGDAMKHGFAGYYINIHTGEFPAGAIRGQLGQ